MRIDLEQEFQEEAEAERATVAVADALRQFSLAARKRALLRALARVRDAIESSEAFVAEKASVIPSIGEQVTLPAPPAPPAVAPGRPDNVVLRGGSLSKRVHHMLLAQPRSPIKELAAALYGVADKKTEANIRSLLDQLKRRKLVRNTGVGEWEAIEG